MSDQTPNDHEDTYDDTRIPDPPDETPEQAAKMKEFIEATDDESALRPE